jgi:hypothetical protein
VRRGMCEGQLPCYAAPHDARGEKSPRLGKCRLSRPPGAHPPRPRGRGAFSPNKPVAPTWNSRPSAFLPECTVARARSGNRAPSFSRSLLHGGSSESCCCCCYSRSSSWFRCWRYYYHHNNATTATTLAAAAARRSTDVAQVAGPRSWLAPGTLCRRRRRARGRYTLDLVGGAGPATAARYASREERRGPWPVTRRTIRARVSECVNARDAHHGPEIYLEYNDRRG